MPGGWQAIRARSAPRGQGGGYIYISLWVDGAAEHWLLHRLVAMLHCANPLSLPEVNHLDGDRANCASSNLEWVTHSDNQKHAARYVHRHVGANHRDAKLSWAQVTELRYKRNTLRMKLNDLAAEYNIDFRSVSAIAKGERYAFEPVL